MEGGNRCVGGIFFVQKWPDVGKNAYLCSGTKQEYSNVDH